MTGVAAAAAAVVQPAAVVAVGRVVVVWRAGLSVVLNGVVEEIARLFC